MKEARELAFNVRGGQRLVPFGITATLQPAGVLEGVLVERGDRVAFVAGFGTPRQVLLARKTCKSIQHVIVDRDAAGRLRMTVEGMVELEREIHWIALELGYGSWTGLASYIDKTYGLPFNGTLVRW